MKLFNYPIAVERGDDKTAFGVLFPDIPGCVSAGDTIEEAIINAKEALKGYLEVLQLDGDPIPEASELGAHIDDPEYNGLVWSYIEMDVTPYMGKSRKVNVTLPEYIISKIDELASTRPEYKTRSGFLAAAAMHELESVR